MRQRPRTAIRQCGSSVRAAHCHTLSPALLFLGRLMFCVGLLGPAIVSVISLAVGHAGSSQEVAERSLTRYDENMMYQASISLWSTNMYLGTRYCGFRNVPAGVPPSVGRGRHGGPQHTFSILAEPDASNRWGNAAAILQLGWKDRHCLKGMGQPVGGEGSKQ